MKNDINFDDIDFTKYEKEIQEIRQDYDEIMRDKKFVRKLRRFQRKQHKRRKNINFDHNATTPPTRHVLRVLRKVYRQGYSNPSAAYLSARETLDKVERARRQVADALGCDADEIFFTSGASESNSWVQAMFLLDVDPSSHHSLERDELGSMATIKAVPLVVSETGNAKNYDYNFTRPDDDGKEYFLDLTQAIGRKKIALHSWSGVAFASASAHKFGGILGCGILYVRRDKQRQMRPLIYGSQEHGLRGGTYNVPAIICCGEAIEEATKNMDRNNKRVNRLALELFISIRDGFNVRAARAGNVVNITFNNLLATTAVELFDKAGFNVSAGSACMAGDEQPNGVYLAAGYGEYEALRTIRISLSPRNNKREIKRFLKALKKIIDNYDK